MKKILLPLLAVLIVIACGFGYQYYTKHRVLYPVMWRCENMIKETMNNPDSYELIRAVMTDKDNEPSVIIEFYGENSYGAKIKSIAGFDFSLEYICDKLPNTAQLYANFRKGKNLFAISDLQSITVGNKKYIGDEFNFLKTINLNKKQFLPYKGKSFPRTISKSELTRIDGICRYSYEMSPKNYEIMLYDPSKLFPYE